jgi:hypothetical protein
MFSATYLFTPEEGDDGDEVAGNAKQDEKNATGHCEVEQHGRIALKEIPHELIVRGDGRVRPRRLLGAGHVGGGWLGGGGGDAHSLAECSISGRRRCGARGCWHSTNANARRPTPSLVSVELGAQSPLPPLLVSATLSLRLVCMRCSKIGCAMLTNAERKVAGRFMRFRFHDFRTKITVCRWHAFSVCVSCRGGQKLQNHWRLFFLTYL